MSEQNTPKDVPSKRPPLLVLLRYYLPQVIHRPIIRACRQFFAIWNINSGNWKWLRGKPLSLTALNRSLWRSAEPSGNFFVLQFLSGVISAMGLLAGSTATIIGAMIIAPLMGPLTSISFALSVGNRRLLKRAGLALLTGCLLTVISAYLLALGIGLNDLNPEITSRIKPTLIDLVVALAAGTAGAFVKTRKRVADALPGVAIAVALVPPLSVIGLGLALESEKVAIGSTLLFATNLAGIIFSGMVVFVWQEYGSLDRAKRGLFLTTIILAGLAIPLALSLKSLVVESKTRNLVNNTIRRQAATFRGKDIRRLNVELAKEYMNIYVEVVAPDDTISKKQLLALHVLLENRLERPVNLNVQVIPIKLMRIPSASKK